MCFTSSSPMAFLSMYLIGVTNRYRLRYYFICIRSYAFFAKSCRMLTFGSTSLQHSFIRIKFLSFETKKFSRASYLTSKSKRPWESLFHVIVTMFKAYLRIYSLKFKPSSCSLGMEELLLSSLTYSTSSAFNSSMRNWFASLSSLWESRFKRSESFIKLLGRRKACYLDSS